MTNRYHGVYMEVQLLITGEGLQYMFLSYPVKENTNSAAIHDYMYDQKEKMIMQRLHYIPLTMQRYCQLAYLYLNPGTSPSH